MKLEKAVKDSGNSACLRRCSFYDKCNEKGCEGYGGIIYRFTKVRSPATRSVLCNSYVPE